MLKRFLTNLVLVSAGLLSVVYMNGVGMDEKAERMVEYRQEQLQAAVDMVNQQVAEKSAGFDRCTDADSPFLTDSILVRGSSAAANPNYDSGVVYIVTMQEAFNQPAGSIVVLAYCI